MHPATHEKLTALLVAGFQATPEQAAPLATRLIKAFEASGLEVVEAGWMQQEPKAEKKEDRWTTLAKAAEELVQERGGIKPWLPPELQ